MPAPPAHPLDGLDQIAWSERWAYQMRDDSPRDARDVPMLLSTLAARRGPPAGGGFDELRRRARRDRTRLRRQAVFELECCLEHQGGLSAATVDVIPFLYRLLVDGPDDPWQRWALLGLLALFAVPQPGNLFPEVVDPTRDYRERDPRCFHACADLEVARASFGAVEAGVDTVVPWIDDPDDRVACEAIGLIALFRRRAEVTLPALRALLDRSGELDVEAGAARIACAMIAEAMLAGDARSTHPVAQLGSRSPLIRLGAACAIAIATPDELPVTAIPMLLAAIPGEVKPPFGFGGGGFTGAGVACLARLPERHDPIVIEALAGRLAGAADDPGFGDLLWLMLSRAFPGGPRADRPTIGHAPSAAAALTAPQRRALEAIRDHVDLEQHAHRDALERIGVPASREALSAWLEA